MADSGADKRGRGGFRGRGRRGGEGEGGAPAEGGERGFGRGRGRGDRGRGERRARRGDAGEGAWVPVTKLGRLVQAGFIKKIEEIFLFSLQIKEYQIVDHFFGSKLKDEALKIMPVQKQTRAGQRTRFKAFILVGDQDGHVGLGVKCSKEVAGAIRGGIIDAKLNVCSVRRGYWGNKVGAPHTVPNKITGKAGSVCVRLVPAPRGTGKVGAPASKKVLAAAGIADVFTSSVGKTKTQGNFVKATFNALALTYGFLTPDLWKDQKITKTPYQEHNDYLQAKAAEKSRAVERVSRA